MKKSRRYLLGTFGSIVATIVLSVTSLRLFGLTSEEAPVRPEPAELEELKNFSAISASGDFRLEIVRQDTFSVEYEAMTQSGSLEATVTDNALQLTGYSNARDDRVSLVRVGMPALEKLDVSFLAEVGISGFTGEALELEFNYTRSVRLQNNQIQSLDLTSTGVASMRWQGNRFTTQQLDIRGNTVVNTSP